MDNIISGAMLLLAQQAKQAPPSLFSPQMILTLWLPMGVIFWFLMIRPQQKERAKMKQMLAAVKKNDRVVTVGGIYGVVTNVHREADEVTIKVDEATNTKLRVTLGSVARVLVNGQSADESSTK